MGVKCPFCQTENDDGVIFCFSCGKEFGLEKVITESELGLKTVHRVDLKDIMKFTLKKMVQISFMMFLMILVAMVFTDLLRK